MPGYYDTEATVYDDSRGGVDRARSAADAVTRLVGTAPTYGVALDVGGGTGIVSAELAAHGWSVLVVDASHGMLRLARDRLPGRVARCDAGRLPVADAAVDLVTAVWLLHLLPMPVADALLAEAARVLRPSGHLVTSVDKHASHGSAPPTDADAVDRVVRVAAGHGFEPSGQTTFTGRSRWGSATDGDPVFRLLCLALPPR